MILNDGIANLIEGHFSLDIVTRDGNIQTAVEDNNTIVNSSFRIISNLLTGASEASEINRLVLGEGGINDGKIQIPRVSDSKLYTPTLNLVGWDEVLISQDVEYSITFIKKIPFNEGNGSGAALYNEAGLFANNTMFARKTFPAQIKTPDREFLIKWTLIQQV